MFAVDYRLNIKLRKITARQSIYWLIISALHYGDTYTGHTLTGTAVKM